MEHQTPDRADPADRDGPAQVAEGAAGWSDAAAAADDAGMPAPVVASGSVQPGAALAPATGEPRVDAALRLLERLPGLPVADHAELFEQVHAQLSDVLGDLDSRPAGPAGG